MVMSFSGSRWSNLYDSDVKWEDNSNFRWFQGFEMERIVISILPLKGENTKWDMMGVFEDMFGGVPSVHRRS